MRRGRILILLALILILGAVAAYFLLRDREPAQPSPEDELIMAPDMIYVVIAGQDISRGAVIPEEGGVVITQMPADLVVETMFNGPEEEGLKSRVVGRRARMDIARGVPITEAMLTDKAGDVLGIGSDASLAIEPGYTAIAIPISRLSSVAYALRDGDSVDVLVTMLMIDLDIDFQSALPNLVTPLIAPGGTDEFPAPIITSFLGEFKDEREEGKLPPFMYGRVDIEPELEQPIHVFPMEMQRPRLVTQRLVEKATVLHMGTFALATTEEDSGSIAEPQPEQGVGAPPPQQGEAQAYTPPPPPDIITLIVTPQDALSLNWAVKSGVDLVLTLRAPGDNLTTETTSVTLQYLLDNYNITVPTKLQHGLEPALEKPIVPVLPNDASPETDKN
jgi:Flp pilus assembly protein CpaB